MEEITVVVLMSTRYLPVFKGHSSAWRGPLCPSGCACRLLGHLVQKPLMRGIGALTAASSVGEKRVCRSSLRTEPGAGGRSPQEGWLRPWLPQRRVRAGVLVSARGAHSWLWRGPCSGRGGPLSGQCCAGGQSLGGLLPGWARPSRPVEAPSPEPASRLGKNAGKRLSDPGVLSRGPAV